MKIALFGGTFDPVHLGHLYVLKEVFRQTVCTDVIIMPAKQSNFKRDVLPSATDQQRLCMLDLAVKDFLKLFEEMKNKNIRISDWEIKKGGISFTSDTVEHIRQELGIKDRIGLIIGEDHIKNLTQWHNFEKIKDEVEFIICPRNSDLQVPDLSNLPADVRYTLLKSEAFFEQSSTAIREKILQHTSYLSENVKKYIFENSLYGA